MAYVIGICDENKNFLKQMSNIVNNYYKKKKDIEIKLFSNPLDVLKNYKKLNLLFLDIEMSELNGLILKRKLEQLDFKGSIIYVTDQEQYMKEAFGKNVIAFIQKNDIERVISVLKSIHEQRKNNKILNISEVSVNIRDIYYLKADYGYVQIHTNNGTHCFYMYLNQLLERVNDPSFVQVHRSYIVNLRYIQTFTANEITLINEDKIKLSRKYKNDFKRLYFEYLKGDLF